MLCPLMVYATAAETGHSVENVTLAHLRYRLGEAEWYENRGLAHGRCIEWLYSQLQHAGHHTPNLRKPRQLAGPADARLANALAHLDQLADMENPQRDDPVVQAWRDVTTMTVQFGGGDEGSDGGIWPVTSNWTSKAGQQWDRLVSQVDAELVTQRGGWVPGAPVRVVGVPEHSKTQHPVTGENEHREYATVVEATWAFDHLTRTIEAGPPPAYFIAYRKPGWSVRQAESEPVPAADLIHDSGDDEQRTAPVR
jgi:hypothetical protein